MRLLILGGTLFLGRHCATAALERGWAVSLFHRGKTGADLFPQAEHLLGDRYGDLAALQGRTFDAVIDCSGQSPRAVRAAMEALGDTHYSFVSTVSVYDQLDPDADEDWPRVAPMDPDPPDLPREAYAGLKVACEDVVQGAESDTCIVRPGLIVGPWDPTERFTYWVRRMQAPGPVLCPGVPDRPVQIIHARDLAEFLLDGAEQRRTGVFNAVTPSRSLTLGQVIRACAQGREVAQVWVPDATLIEDHDLQIWSDLPLWLTDDHLGMETVDVGQALSAGLRLRSLAETVADTWSWAQEHPAENAVAIGREREASILEAWSSKSPPLA